MWNLSDHYKSWRSCLYLWWNLDWATRLDIYSVLLIVLLIVIQFHSVPDLNQKFNSYPHALYTQLITIPSILKLIVSNLLQLLHNSIYYSSYSRQLLVHFSYGFWSYFQIALHISIFSHHYSLPNQLLLWRYKVFFEKVKKDTETLRNILTNRRWIEVSQKHLESAESLVIFLIVWLPIRPLCLIWFQKLLEA